MKASGIAAVLAALACAACATGYLGVPDGDDVRIDSPYGPLHGVVTMTKVRPASRETYRWLKAGGHVVKEERRDGHLYFATKQTVCIVLPGGDAGAGGRQLVEVTNRYRTKLPGAE